MDRFLFVYRRDLDAAGRITPEAMEKSMERWRVWIEKGLEQGWLLDPGDGLKQDGKVVRPANVVTDGPFVESKEIVGGYSVVQADSIEAARELARGCPALLNGASVEIRQLAGYTAAIRQLAGSAAGK
jgi:hypothetical protein